MTDSGGSIQPYQPKDGEVLAHLSDGDTWPAVWRPREDWAHPTYDEGGVLPTGATIAHNASSTAEQVERGAAWIRDHYRDGEFRCPASPDSPDA